MLPPRCTSPTQHERHYNANDTNNTNNITRTTPNQHPRHNHHNKENNNNNSNHKNEKKQKERSSTTKIGVARTRKQTPKLRRTDEPTKLSRKNGHLSSLTITQQATMELTVDKWRRATRSEQRGPLKIVVERRNLGNDKKNKTNDWGKEATTTPEEPRLKTPPTTLKPPKLREPTQYPPTPKLDKTKSTTKKSKRQKEPISTSFATCRQHKRTTTEK